MSDKKVDEEITHRKDDDKYWIHTQEAIDEGDVEYVGLKVRDKNGKLTSTAALLNDMCNASRFPGFNFTKLLILHKDKNLVFDIPKRVLTKVQIEEKK